MFVLIFFLAHLLQIYWVSFIHYLPVISLFVFQLRQKFCSICLHLLCIFALPFCTIIDLHSLLPHSTFILHTCVPRPRCPRASVVPLKLATSSVTKSRENNKINNEIKINTFFPRFFCLATRNKKYTKTTDRTK